MGTGCIPRSDSSRRRSSDEELIRPALSRSGTDRVTHDPLVRRHSGPWPEETVTDAVGSRHVSRSPNDRSCLRMPERSGATQQDARAPMAGSSTDEQHRAPAGNQDFILEAELAKRWRRSVRTLQRWRKKGDAPDHHLIRGRILYRRSVIEAVETACLRRGRKSS